MHKALQIDDDARRTSTSYCGKMKIGDFVTYEGRAYILRGLEPMSVPDRRAHLEDAENGERLVAPLRELFEGTPGVTRPGLPQES
jgi:hypothetical protein